MEQKKRSRGFALIAALCSIWILTAMGLLVFTVTTQDVRVSSRVVGEKKAFNAAEAGVQTLTQNFNPTLTDGGITAGTYQVDTSSYGDPASQYTLAAPTLPTWGPAHISKKGFDLEGTGWSRHLADVTGTNTNYNSNVAINVGIGYGPSPITTDQPSGG
jgi:hypothetical protein